MRSSDSPVVTRSVISVPKYFSFWRTVHSHGWSSLPPFLVDKERHELKRQLRLAGGVLVQCALRESSSGISVRAESRRPLTPSQRSEVREQLRSCFRLDEDLSEFFSLVGNSRSLRWIRTSGSGRLLRAPTVFEDLVKMMCTTNCTWGLTEVMVNNLTTKLGEEFPAGVFSFPTPAKMASPPEGFMRKEIRSGYRSPYLVEFAERVASGKLDVESWRESKLRTEELFKEVRTVKGVGEYAAGNLLRLLGRYDYLALDSWVRAKYAEIHHHGRKVSDGTIERAYKKYGSWRGLIFWYEMTKDWLSQKFPF
ncbi:MAG: Fe-S cluster assembly protein HesB [Bacteroidota bacterium]